MAVAGEDNKSREIPFLGKSFATDIENGTPGWLLIGEGMRNWQPFPIDEPPPPSPGPNYKRGFSVLLYAPKLLGSFDAHEMCSSTGAHLSFCERLYNEAEQQFGQGNVPIVKITEAEPVKIGKGKSRELHFEIVKWIPRPAAFTEALAKLKAAASGPPKNAAADAAAQGDDFTGDDFVNDDTTAATAPKEEPTTEAKKPEKTAKRRKREAPPEKSDLSDLLDD
jgi:hypothetical protein